jgi:outer membrane immunogenic protein
MKKLLLAVVSGFAWVGIAYGADMAPAFKAPPPPLATWTGFYLGIDGGVARHDAQFNDLTIFFNGSSMITSKTGGVFGGYAGYNWQDRSFVYGIEADINGVAAKATETWGPPINFSTSYAQSQDVPWVATFRGRMGIDYESTLFYFTGGLAVGRVENSFNGFCGPAGCLGGLGGAMFGGLTDDTTRLGWTAGAGVEHMFSSHWTVRGEFRYVDLGRKSAGCLPALVTGCDGTSTGRPVPVLQRGEFSNTLMNALVGIGYKL